MNEKKVPTLIKIIAVIYTALGIGAVCALAVVLSTMSLIFNGPILNTFLIILMLLALGVLIFSIGRYLYKGKNWARMTVILLGSLSTLNSAYIIFTKGTPENYLIFGSSCFMTLLITCYLTFNQKVVETFEIS